MLPVAKLAGGLSQQLCQTASHFLSLRFAKNIHVLSAGSIGLTAAGGGNPVIQNDSKGLVVVSVKASGGMKGGMMCNTDLVTERKVPQKSCQVCKHDWLWSCM